VREARKRLVSVVLVSDHNVFAEGLGMVLCATEDIPAERVLSLNTVRAHVQNVLVKLGVHMRLEAAAFAVRRGFAAS
jgi:two-component system, NarL family, nitrate/nitrite response regulator NarL